MTIGELFCPLCRTKLVPGDRICYETLDDHICRPNAMLPLRSTVTCQNRTCKAYWAKMFWASDGEGPYGGPLDEKLPWIDGNPLPFGSYHRAIHFSCSYHEEDRCMRVGKLLVRREIKYASDDYGHKTGKRVRYTIWWNNILWTPGYRMLLHSIRQFYRMKKLGDQHAATETRSMIQRSHWPRAEWWRKASCTWVRVVHPTLYKEASS